MLAFALALLALSSVHAQEKVAIAELDWDGGTAISHVLMAIIEGPLSSEAHIIDGLADQAIVLDSMDAGNGAVDVHPDLWIPLWQAHWDKYIDGRKTIATNQPYAATEHIFMPRYMAKTVQSIKDLDSPKIAALFDTNGNGKGEYWAGDPNWGATKVTQIKFKSHGLSELWEPTVTPMPEFLAELEAAYVTQKPILFYHFTPGWLYSAYDLVVLEEPEPFAGCADLKLDQADWLAASTMKCRMESSKVYIAYSKSLEKRNPPVARLLSNIRLDPAEINDWIHKIAREKQDPREVAEAWVKENYATVAGWIK